jgi:hypothetical protein
VTTEADAYPPLEDVFFDTSACHDRVWVILNELTVVGDTPQLLYAALELRFMVERLLRDVLMTVSFKALSRRQLDFYRAKDIVAELRRICPDFTLRWEFLTLVYGATGLREPFPSLDLDELVSRYGKLGDFLHAPRAPNWLMDNPDWKERLEVCVTGTYQYLAPYRALFPRAHVFAGHNVEWLFQQFAAGKAEPRQVRRLAAVLRASL